MKHTIIAILSTMLISCGSGDTGEGYEGSRRGLNPDVRSDSIQPSESTRIDPEENGQADPYDERHRPESSNIDVEHRQNR